jgi:SAM-dependent methyltransferase
VHALAHDFNQVTQLFHRREWLDRVPRRARCSPKLNAMSIVHHAIGQVRRPILQLAAKVLRSVSLRTHRADEDAAADTTGFDLHRGYRLPPKTLRGKMCGDAFRTDSFYFLSAVLEASKFAQRLGGTPHANVVDIGSGLGRLATGLLSECPGVQYLGIDANREFVRWCQDHIESEHPGFRFVHLDMANALYNPAGTISGRELRLPVDDASADVVNLWGVFTNMVPEDVQAYVREISRILRPQGLCFLTAFAEDGVPDVTLNPTDYVPYACELPLTCVRYSKTWLFETFRQHGLRVQEFRHHGSMFPKQSEIYLVKSKADSPAAELRS